MKLTVIVNWKNKSIPIIPIKEYIERLKFSDEILLTGKELNHSIKEIIKSDKVKIFPLHEPEYNFQIQNHLLSKAKGDWVLYVNSDEVINKELAREIREKIHSSKFDGYFINIVDRAINKLINTNDYMNVFQLRLGKKNKGIWESEGNGYESWEINGNMGILKKPLIRVVNPTLEELISEINTSTTFRANELFLENKKENFITVVFFPIGKFLIDFFYKRGFLYGSKGFVYAVTMSFRTFLTRAKLWLLWKNESL